MLSRYDRGRRGHAILGMDLFQDGEGKRFLIDMFKRSLIDRVTLEDCPVETACSSVYTVIPTSSPLSDKWSYITEDADHCAELHDDEYTQLWMDFPFTDPSMSKIVSMITPVHIATEGPPVNTSLHITTEGPPVYTPRRKLHGEKKAQVEEQLRQWERKKSLSRVNLIGHHRSTR